MFSFCVFEMAKDNAVYSLCALTSHKQPLLQLVITYPKEQSQFSTAKALLSKPLVLF